jgi:ribonuclease P/MRP protein subunit RPP40
MYDKKLQVDTAILDFSKAFDTVPHNKLLYKLDNYGVSRQVLQWIKEFLTRRTQQVLVEGTQSTPVRVELGVPQGTVLGPILFLAHINDLPTCVQSSVRLFADDCLLYREIRTFQDHLDFQSDLKALEAWAKNWGVSFYAK